MSPTRVGPVHTFASGIAVEREILRHSKATIADTDGLPKVGETGRWVERLEVWSDYAAACLAVFLQSKRVDLTGTIDNGGNKNLHKDMGFATSVYVTQKPVECMRRPMRNNSAPGDAVYDPFLDSGMRL